MKAKRKPARCVDCGRKVLVPGICVDCRTHEGVQLELVPDVAC